MLPNDGGNKTSWHHNRMTKSYISSVTIGSDREKARKTKHCDKFNVTAHSAYGYLRPFMSCHLHTLIRCQYLCLNKEINLRTKYNLFVWREDNGWQALHLVPLPFHSICGCHGEFIYKYRPKRESDKCSHLAVTQAWIPSSNIRRHGLLRQRVARRTTVTNVPVQ